MSEVTTFRTNVRKSAESTTIEKLIFKTFLDAIQQADSYDVTVGINEVCPDAEMRKPFYVVFNKLDDQGFIARHKQRGVYRLLKAGKNRLADSGLRNTEVLHTQAATPGIEESLQLGIQSLTALAATNKLLADTLQQISSLVNEALVQIENDNNNNT